MSEGKKPWGARVKRDWAKNKWLYAMILPVLLFYLIFCYVPMGGVIMAFENYKPSKGIFGSEWVGLKHFEAFFRNPFFWRLIRNTILISLYNLIFSFPAPIILALILNECRFRKVGRVAQTISYFPHFVSTVVVCGMLRQFCLSDGLFNSVLSFAGVPVKSWLQIPGAFRTIYIVSGIWQSVGWSSIIYIAAIAGVDTQLYEAAEIDGAGRWKRILHVTLPSIKPTIIILFIMQVGKMMSVGYEKIILLYNPSIYETADVISSYVYRKGLQDSDWSYSTAVNLFNSVINFALVIVTNKISSKASETSLF